MNEMTKDCAGCSLSSEQINCRIFQKLEALIAQAKNPASTPAANETLCADTKADIQSLVLKSKRPLNKNLIQSYIMEKAGVTYEQARNMFDVLVDLIKYELSPQGSGRFDMPGIFNCQVHARSVKGTKPETKSPSLRVSIDKELREKVSSRSLSDYEHLSDTK